VDDLKKIIKMHLVKECPITVKDIKLAEAIYGPDLPIIEGIVSCGRLTTIVKDIWEIPEELVLWQHLVDLCIKISL